MTLALLERHIPRLTDRVTRLSPPDRHRLVRAAIELAALERPVDDPRAADALEALRTGSEHAPEQLQSLIDELDDRSAELSMAWDDVRFDNPGSERAEELGRAHQETFEQARALEALHIALTEDVQDPAVIGDVLYAANGAIGFAPPAIEALVEAVEDRLADPVKHARRRLASGGRGPTDPGTGPGPR